MGAGLGRQGGRDMTPVGLVVVSHSRALADAAVALAREMATGDLPIEVAAGVDDGFGTDAAAIAAAIGAADRGAGVVVLMDLGSAVLSAELALELLDDPDLGERVVLCPAPLVEGLVVASVVAAGGAGRVEVAAEAAGALAGKLSQLAPAAAPAPVDEPVAGVRARFTVRIPHGLHARPAARLVALVRGLDGPDVRIRNATTGSAWVAAGSLSAVATLGALQGHDVEVTATGPGAAAAVEAVAALAGRTFDERTSAPAGGGQESHFPVPTGPESGFPALPAPLAPGVAVGPAFRFRVAVPLADDGPVGEPAAERARLDAARDAVRSEIRSAAAAVGPAEAAIFEAHLLLLDDPELLDPALAAIDGGTGAARAWADATTATADAFAALPDPYLAGRAADVRAVGAQVLVALAGAAAVPAVPTGAVLVAPDLTPARAATLPAVAGVVLGTGSPTSHAAILLRARGVPAVLAAADVADGTVLAFDGATGELAIDPPPDVLERFRDRAEQQQANRDAAIVRAAEPAVTRGGVHVLVGANVGSATDATAAVGADLVGLLRTEFLFLDRPEAPGVDEQEAAYRAVAEAMGGRRVTLRTLDAGGDKPLPYLPLPAEANPFLGLRGIRLAGRWPHLLADQLLAAVRVAHDAPLSIMFPMVSVLDELLDARRALERAIAAEGRGTPPGLQVGIMVEVPAAALKAERFVPHLDFLSIGTNDLTQYALAAERGNTAVAALADPLDPGVLRLVDAVCRAAGDRALVAVCGEAAADPRAAEAFVGLGVRELSVAPALVAETKQVVRALSG
ncbi:phosphoenolpyruvate--protein phosphotransferase [Actinomycetes bacterium KLBMP 9759]